jgi:hypothetical protein
MCRGEFTNHRVGSEERYLLIMLTDDSIFDFFAQTQFFSLLCHCDGGSEKTVRLILYAMHV